MDTLALAKQRMLWKEEWRDKANDGTDQELHDYHVEFENLCRSDAIAYAAIAQADALARMADAAERRNVLLEEYNAESKANAERHTDAIATSVGKFVNAVYGEDDKAS